MAVTIGSARIDENGKAYGGLAGDQTGREVSTQSWYKHPKGWVLLRPRNAAQAEKIAACMKAACANSHIGYDQWQRNTLYTVAEKFGFDVARVTIDCETDCSALVRVCCAFAGLLTSLAFRTTNEADVLMATGAFEKLTAAKYTEKSDYLKPGDILVTKTQGHTVVVLTKGPNADEDEKPSADGACPYTEPGEKEIIKPRSALKEKVKWVQWHLDQLDYDLGDAGIDGDFGSMTDKAVRAFQTKAEIKVDGEVGPITKAALKATRDASDATTYDEDTTGKCVDVTRTGTWNIRRGPGTEYGVIRTAAQGESFSYVSTAENGWYEIELTGGTGWISPVCTTVTE